MIEQLQADRQTDRQLAQAVGADEEELEKERETRGHSESCDFPFLSPSILDH